MPATNTRIATREAQRLVGTPAARELVPAVAGQSARWHTHDYPGPYCRWNYHPEYEVHLIQHGVGRFIVGDHIGTFSAGQLVLVGSYLPHHWISDLAPGEAVKNRDVVFQFHPKWVGDCQQLMPELHALDPLLRRAGRGLEFEDATAATAAVHLISIGHTEHLVRLRHIFALLDTMATAPPQGTRQLASRSAPEATDAGAADIVDRVLGYIADPRSEVSMSAAAAMVGMSPSGFSRYFKRTAGQSFSDTVRKMRMAQACQLLERTELPIASVAQRVGYQNLSNFNRQFHRQHQMTPTSYRRRHADRQPRE